MSVNSAGLRIIKEFEGFKSYPYKCPAGVYTIGFGHTHGVTALSTPITENEAEGLLLADLKNAEAIVQKLASCPLNENQYSALVSLVFNVGQGPLMGTLGHYLDQDDYASAADQFLKWVHIGPTVSPGLVRRREAERKLFLTPITPT